MRSLLASLAFSISLCAHAQAPQSRVIDYKVFSEAAVVLNTGVIRTGSLRFYPDKDVVVLTCANDSIYTLPARLVRGFSAKYDPVQQPHRPGDTYVASNRIFRTFTLPPKEHATSSWGYYEQLNRGSGPALLLRREQLVPCEIVLPGVGPGALKNQPPQTNTIPDCRIVTTLYLRTVEGALVRLHKPQEVLKYLAPQAAQLRAYVQQNNLHYANFLDLSFLVNYANTILKKSS
jgi:hypothetical protein